MILLEDQVKRAWNGHEYNFDEMFESTRKYITDADLSIGDHTHSVQPAMIAHENGRNIFTAFSPGNYSNVYREFNGDANITLEVYIDIQTCI